MAHVHILKIIPESYQHLLQQRLQKSTFCSLPISFIVMRSSMHRWGIPKVNAMADHFLLYACGGNDFGVTIISEERQIFSAQYLTAAWNGDEPPSGSEQTVFEQLYAPTEIKRQNKKRKRDSVSFLPSALIFIQLLSFTLKRH